MPWVSPTAAIARTDDDAEALLELDNRDELLELEELAVGELLLDALLELDDELPPTVPPVCVSAVGPATSEQPPNSTPPAVTPDRSSRNSRRSLVLDIRILVSAGAALEIQFDATNHVRRRNHMHTAGQPANDIDAQLIRLILAVAVSDGDDA